MCDILHARHRSLWLRANWIFNLTNLAKQQIKLLGTIHGLTMKVIRNKKNAFKQGARGSLARTEINTKGFGNGLEDFRSNGSTTTVEGLSFGQSAGLKDDLDVDNEADDVGEKKRLAFLDLLLESAQNGALITDREIKEQVPASRLSIFINNFIFIFILSLFFYLFSFLIFIYIYILYFLCLYTCCCYGAGRHHRKCPLLWI